MKQSISIKYILHKQRSLTQLNSETQLKHKYISSFFAEDYLMNFHWLKYHTNEMRMSFWINYTIFNQGFASFNNLTGKGQLFLAQILNVYDA